MTPLWRAAGAEGALLLCGAGASGSLSRTSPPDVFPFPVHERTLDNRTRRVVVPYEGSGLVSFDLVVRTGSRDDVAPGHSGFAHFSLPLQCS